MIQTLVDWLSFTVPAPLGLDGDGSDVTYLVFQLIVKALGDELSDDLLSMAFERTGGRAPYSIKATREDHFATIFWGPKSNHILIELSGGALEKITRKNLLLKWIDAVRPRVTRIDLACDMPVAYTPAQFVAAGYSDRFKSSGHLISETGETFYVGSQKSDRFARVYRYNPPHPRAHLLRCEYVFRKEQARLVAAELIDKGLLATASSAGISFAWKHPAWQPDNQTTERLPSWRPDRHKAGTVNWIIEQCFPALANLVRLGEIEDLSAFLNDHLNPLL